MKISTSSSGIFKTIEAKTKRQFSCMKRLVSVNLAGRWEKLVKRVVKQIIEMGRNIV